MLKPWQELSIVRMAQPRRRNIIANYEIPVSKCEDYLQEGIFFCHLLWGQSLETEEAYGFPSLLGNLF